MGLMGLLRNSALGLDGDWEATSHFSVPEAFWEYGTVGYLTHLLQGKSTTRSKHNIPKPNGSLGPSFLVIPASGIQNNQAQILP